MYCLCHGKTGHVVELFSSSPILTANALIHVFVYLFLSFFSYISVVSTLVTIFHVVTLVGTTDCNSIYLYSPGERDAQFA